jgi:peptidoglycan/xylan/chitin deacetylase (PgdA/CDA1 family)
LKQALKKFVYRSISLAQYDRAISFFARGALRILNYHGVCEDHLAREPWMPPSFITRSNFEWQLQYLSKRATVLSLAEALARLQAGNLPRGAVALTFDDGYANNLTVAYPILRKFGTPATIFLATHYIESGDFFVFDRPRFLGQSQGNGQDTTHLVEEFWQAYRRGPLDAALAESAPWWNQISARITVEQRDALRPLTLNELMSLDPGLVELGAHTHRHPILRFEHPDRREWEIATSIARVREWTGRPVRFFAYPNGKAGEFDEFDKQVLRSHGIAAAFSTIHGLNRKNQDPFAYRRIGVGLYHNSDEFVAESAGVNHLLRTIAFQRSG